MFILLGGWTVNAIPNCQTHVQGQIDTNIDKFIDRYCDR